MGDKDPRIKMQRLAAAYGRALDALGAVVGEIESKRRRAVRRRLPDLHKLHGKAARARAKLLAAVDAAPAAFARPRSQTIAGARYGWRTRAAAVVPGPDTVALVKKLLPDKAGVLIRTREEVVVPALRELTAEEIKLVGAKVVPAVDEAFVRSPRSELESQAQSMLADARERGR